MIESLTEEEAKEMLKEISNRQPAVILDVASVLSCRQQQPQGSPGPVAPQPSWCVCTKCPPMDRDEDKVCC